MTPFGLDRKPPATRQTLRLLAAAALLALLWPTVLTANPESVAARHAGSQLLRFERLSVEEGLSVSFVNCMLQDRTGFLWLGTQGGLNRYDGYDFEVYRHDADNPASLGHDWILALAEDDAGDLWVGTEGGGLSRWHRQTGTFSTYRHDPADPQSLSGDRIVGLAWDPSGNLWIATLASGLNRLDPAEGTFERFRHDPDDPGSLSHDQTGAVHVDRFGNVWVGTWGGLDLYDPRRRAFTHFRHDPDDPASLSDNRVRAILEDHKGDLWIGTQSGLNRFVHPARRGESGPFERFLNDAADPGSLSHDWVRALYQDRDGRLWVGTDGGLNLWREDDRSFVRYHPDPRDPHSLASDQVTALYQDRNGILWVSTVGTGVNKWNPATWAFGHHRSDPSNDGVANDNVFAISEDRQGGVWTGTFGGGLERLDRASGHRVRYRHDPADDRSLADDRVTALLHDRDGVLWVGTVGGGLHRLDRVADDRVAGDRVAGDRVAGDTSAAGRFERFRHDPQRPDSLSRDAVTALHQDRRGRLWIGTWRGGLNLYLGGDKFFPFRHDPEDSESLGHDQVFALAEDEIGRLWIATDGGGLNRLDPRTRAFLRLRHDPADPGSLTSDELLSVHVDGAGRLWAGTKGSGLDLLRSLDGATRAAVFRNYSAADGLPDETIWGLVSDGAGDLWVSTSLGLSRLDPETETFRNYDTSHGLQSREFNQGAVFKSPSGELFFGGTGGWNAFFPHRVRGTTAPPPVVLTGFTRFNQPVDLSAPLFDLDRLELTYRDHFLAFEFAALDFTAPEKNRYRYRISGLDDTWVELGHERRVTFASLEPGRYTLRVQGANHDGVWNEEGASLRLAVAPPPWLSWWAYTLYLLAAAAIVWGYVRRHRREVEAERAATRRERTVSEERQRLLEERERLIDDLAAKNAELKRFNYTVSHDLKSPLVTIKGFLGLLEKDAAAGDVDRLKHDVRRIGAAADRMSRLLEELLELSSLGSKVRPPEEVPLSELAGEALETISEVAERGVEVVIDPRLPVVFGDRVYLLQLYQKLLANAVKYLGDQRSPRVEVGHRRGDEPVLFVKDNGMGIDQRYHEKVFGLFERLDARDEGTGVGLALAKRIVEMHGGRIWVESEGLGCGSSFCFTLAALRREVDREAAKGGKVVVAGDRFR